MVMAGPIRTPNGSTLSNPPSLKKSTSGSQSSMSQKSIASFFQRRIVEDQAAKVNVPTKLPTRSQPANGGPKKPSKPARGSSPSLTPAPSSDAIQEDDVEDEVLIKPTRINGAGSLPSPVTPAGDPTITGAALIACGRSVTFDSPSRKV